MFKGKKIKENTARLLEECHAFIRSSELATEPSCENDLIELCRKKCEAAKEEISTYTEQTNFKELAAIMLVNFSFNSLSSGRYHIYRGMLDPLSCANNMLRVYKKCMAYGCEIGLITQADFDDQLDYLNELISSVG